MLRNVRKSRILLSIAIIALIFVLLGNSYSLATEGGNTVTITATTENTGSSDNTNTNTDTNTNTNVNAVSNVTSIVSSNNNTANNTSTYNTSNTTTNTSSLPHTGTDSKTVLLVVVFALSAVYAYKKVNDYNF